MIRRKTTKEILGESIHELAAKKPLDKITVREIVENCALSPATFYHHFHDKYALINWVYNCQMEDIFLDFCEGKESWRQALLDMITILERDRGFYLNASKNTQGPNSFLLSAHLRCVELLTEVIKASGAGTADEEVLFDVKFYLRGVSYSVIDWFLNEPPYSVEQLADCLCGAIPEKLKPFLV